MTARRQRGFAYIAAIVLLVVLAGFALAALRLSGSSQAAVTQAVVGARASQAARGGIEWALYQLRNVTGNADTAGTAASNACAAIRNRVLTDFVGATGFRVQLNCTAYTFGEGQTADANGNVVGVTKNIFQLDATACNGASAGCPDNGGVTNPDYVERRRSASICVTTDGRDCY